VANKRKPRQRQAVAGRSNRQAAARQTPRRTIIGVALASLAVLAVIVTVVLTQRDDSPRTAGGTSQATVTGVDPRQAHDLMTAHRGDTTWVTLDVRTPDEFAAEHLADATNIDFNASTFQTKVAALDHARTYIVYCHTGNRSGKAAAIMHDLGFTHVYDVKGGIAAWQQAGLPTTA
jgi:rhodanese-related sulfurtransferase